MSDRPPQQRWEKVVEILEVSLLAIVAIATAYSGYQGTQWGGEQARLYGLASSTRFEAEAASTLGGQELVADASFFTAWLQAHEAGHRQLETMLENRFTPEYAAAFDDWLALDPFTNPDVPRGRPPTSTCARRCCSRPCCSSWRSRSASGSVGSGSARTRSHSRC